MKYIPARKHAEKRGREHTKERGMSGHESRFKHLCEPSKGSNNTLNNLKRCYTINIASTIRDKRTNKNNAGFGNGELGLQDKYLEFLLPFFSKDYSDHLDHPFLRNHYNPHIHHTLNPPYHHTLNFPYHHTLNFPYRHTRRTRHTCYFHIPQVENKKNKNLDRRRNSFHRNWSRIEKGIMKTLRSLH